MPMFRPSRVATPIAVCRLDDRIVPTISAGFANDAGAAAFLVTWDHTAATQVTLVTAPNGDVRVQAVWDPDGPGVLPAVTQAFTVSGGEFATAALDLGLGVTAPRRFKVVGNDGADLISAVGLTNYDVDLRGGNGNDSITGGALHDTLQGGGGNDTINADGADFVPMLGITSVGGGAGSDLLSVSGTAGITYINDGFETIVGTPSNDAIDSSSSAGNVTILGGDGNDTLTGGSGNDSLVGSSGADSLTGGAGDDVLEGGADGDALFGGTGNDSLVGGTGHDTLQGGAGADTLQGGADVDTVDYASDVTGVAVSLLTHVAAGGDAAGDVLSGFENVNGGAGPDLLFGENSLAGNVINGNGGDDFILGLSGNDTLNGGAGNDDVDGGKGNDRLDGGTGNDDLLGRDGNDSLTGGDGDDYLQGGGSVDRVNGQLGADAVEGGAGADVFIMNFSEAFGPGGTQDSFYGGYESDTYEFRGVSKVLGSPPVTVLDEIKVANMLSYMQVLAGVNQTDIDMDVDNLTFTLLAETAI